MNFTQLLIKDYLQATETDLKIMNYCEDEHLIDAYNDFKEINPTMKPTFDMVMIMLLQNASMSIIEHLNDNHESLDIEPVECAPCVYVDGNNYIIELMTNNPNIENGFLQFFETSLFNDYFYEVLEEIEVITSIENQ